MHIFQLVVPFIIGYLTMIGMPMLLAALILLGISFTEKDEDSKKKKRKLAYYLCIPIVLIFIVVILWGIVGFISAFTI
jgi:hypothetical protein